MDPKPGGRDRLLTVAIVVLSVAGVLYFGTRAVMDRMKTDTKNPYALDLSVFEGDRADRLAYHQTQDIAIPLERPRGLARDGDGNLYVSGDEVVLKYDAEGNRVGSYAIGETAYCLAVDGQGLIYLGMKDHVEVLDPTGKPIAHWESLGPRAIVTCVAVSDSAVYLADAGQLLVWEFTPSGSLRWTLGKKDPTKGVPGYVIPSPYFDVAVGTDGSPWVANTGRHSLENYTPSGALKTSWGEYGTAIEAFCGCCNPSHFAIMSDGGFVTSEKGIARIKTYDR
ncbi:MAG: hypothetical protein QGI83_14980, partial [Candidatus Latescibacteria bacterium]|nr:hypothetical protein [Candidatus Latescibacterota bacterium]